MRIERIPHEGFARVGESVVTSNDREMREGESRIGPLWGRYFARRGGKPVGVPVAIYDRYEGDHRGAYRITVADEGEFPGGERVEVPGGWFARFVSEGDQPAALVAAWREIWRLTEEGVLRRTFRADFERHVSDRRVEIHVSVESRGAGAASTPSAPSGP